MRASRMTAAPPSTQESSAAGPAMREALSAPNNQPEPMIEPTDVNRSPTIPTSRRSFRAAAGDLPTVGEAVVIASPPSPAIYERSPAIPIYRSLLDLLNMVP